MDELTAKDLAEGQEVRVFDRSNGRRTGQPEGGWPGVITRVGRVLVTINYGHRISRSDREYHKTTDFRIGTQWLNDKQYGTATRFMTMEQAAKSLRRSAAIKALQKHRHIIRLEAYHDFSTEKLEALAGLLESSRIVLSLELPEVTELIDALTDFRRGPSDPRFDMQRELKGRLMSLARQLAMADPAAAP